MMTPSRCEIHNVVEEEREGDYLTCLECGHVFRTAEELVEADFAWQDEGWQKGWTKVPPKRHAPQDIYPCPHCSHDL